MLGIAIGFAVRDVMENYLASVLLSLRQPFRPHDHVVIEGREGRVVRLTSRATILLTIEGNHLRIPNADVFKATILNYTRNPQRRLDFELGIAADDDPAAALAAGVAVMSELPYVLREPPAGGQIKRVGESSIVIEMWAWIDQRERDFLKARSAVLAEVKRRLEAGGYTLPEPIFRVRLEDSASLRTPASPSKGGTSGSVAPTAVDTARDSSLDRLVDEERRDETDLLAEDAPTE